MADLRVPSITSNDPKTQLVQIKSYLFQLVDQLNYTIGLVEKSTHELEVKHDEDLTEVNKMLEEHTNRIKNVLEAIKTSTEPIYEKALFLDSIPREPGMYKLGGYRDTDGSARFIWFEGL